MAMLVNAIHGLSKNEAVRTLSAKRIF